MSGGGLLGRTVLGDEDLWDSVGELNYCIQGSDGKEMPAKLDSTLLEDALRSTSAREFLQLIAGKMVSTANCTGLEDDQTEHELVVEGVVQKTSCVTVAERALLHLFIGRQFMAKQHLCMGFDKDKLPAGCALVRMMRAELYYVMAVHCGYVKTSGDGGDEVMMKQLHGQCFLDAVQRVFPKVPHTGRPECKGKQICDQCVFLHPDVVAVLLQCEPEVVRPLNRAALRAKAQAANAAKGRPADAATVGANKKRKV